MVLPDKSPSPQPKLPPGSERRAEIIRLEKRRRKVLQRLRRANLEVVFDNETTTAFGNFAAIETFKRAIGFSVLPRVNTEPSVGELERTHLRRCEKTHLIDILPFNMI